MSLPEILNDPKYSSVVQALMPYIPAIKRSGEGLFNDVVKSAISGDWDNVNQVAWRHMTEDERDAASNALLKEAQDAVDRAYEREQLAKEIAFKLVGTLLTMLL